MPQTQATDIQPASAELNIHDTSRDRIVIRPRCKEYVKKQRALNRTLACFTSLEDIAAPNPTTPSDPHSSTSSSQSPVAAQTTQKENRKERSTVINVNEASERPRSGRTDWHRNATTSKVLSGRVEKPKSPKPSVIRIAEKFHACAPASYPVVRYDCTCLNPAECTRCQLLALADRFCAIVVAREQRLKMYAWTKSKLPHLQNIH